MTRHTSGEAGTSAVRPLFAAGFVTAFGAHSVAATLGFTGPDLLTNLLDLGVLLALYDGAEVLLKPVFGALADRIGPRPVLLGGLLGFAVASAAFVVAGTPAGLGLARFAQGSAAAAFSPAAGAMIARIAPDRRRGRAFGSYGAWKGLGYALGPLLGGVLIELGGSRLLFFTLTVLALVVAGWTVSAVPGLPPLPRARQTVLDLARRLSDRGFLGPTVALAASTAALSVGVGFLPVRRRPRRRRSGGHRCGGLGPGRDRGAEPTVGGARPGRRAARRPYRHRRRTPDHLSRPHAAGRALPRRRAAGRRCPHRRRHGPAHPAGLRCPRGRRPARTARADHGCGRDRARARGGGGPAAGRRTHCYRRRGLGLPGSRRTSRGRRRGNRRNALARPPMR